MCLVLFFTTFSFRRAKNRKKKLSHARNFSKIFSPASTKLYPLAFNYFYIFGRLFYHLNPFLCSGLIDKSASGNFWFNFYNQAKFVYPIRLLKPDGKRKMYFDRRRMKIGIEPNGIPFIVTLLGNIHK